MVQHVLQYLAKMVLPHSGVSLSSTRPNPSLILVLSPRHLKAPIMVRTGYEKIQASIENETLISSEDDTAAVGLSSNRDLPRQSTISTLTWCGIALLISAYTTLSVFSLLSEGSRPGPGAALRRVQPLDAPGAPRPPGSSLKDYGFPGWNNDSGGAVDVAILMPKIVSRVSRLTPTSVLSYPSDGLAEHVVLTHDDSAILQFDNLDSSKRFCALVNLGAEDGQPFTVLGPKNTALVWQLNVSTPLDPSTISFVHRPPRLDYVGWLGFDNPETAATATFPCPEERLTVELQAQEWACAVHFDQPYGGTPTGVVLALWN